MKLFDSLFLFFWGFLFVGAAFLKIVTHDIDLWLLTIVTVDLAGAYFCFFTNKRWWTWSALASFQLAFLTFHSINQYDCNCFGSFSIDKSILLPLETVSFGICMWKVIRDRLELFRGLDDAEEDPNHAVKANLAFSIFVSFFCVCIFWLSELSVVKDSSIDLSVGKSVDFSPTGFKPDFEIVVYHANCKKCLAKMDVLMNSKMNTKIAVCLLIFRGASFEEMCGARPMAFR